MSWSTRLYIFELFSFSRAQLHRGDNMRDPAVVAVTMIQR